MASAAPSACSSCVASPEAFIPSGALDASASAASKSGSRPSAGDGAFAPTDPPQPWLAPRSTAALVQRHPQIQVRRIVGSSPVKGENATGPDRTCSVLLRRKPWAGLTRSVVARSSRHGTLIAHHVVEHARSEFESLVFGQREHVLQEPTGRTTPQSALSISTSPTSRSSRTAYARRCAGRRTGSRRARGAR